MRLAGYIELILIRTNLDVLFACTRDGCIVHLSDFRRVPASVWERPRGTTTIIAIRWWRREEWLVLCSPTVMSVSLAAAVAVGHARLPGEGPCAGRELSPVP
jgi:hypothetical protein